MFKSKTKLDRMSRIIGLTIMGTAALIAAGFGFLMDFSWRPGFATLFSLSFSVVFLAISLVDYWLAWKFYKGPVISPNS